VLARLLFCTLLGSAQLTYASVKLTPETASAFDRYVQLTETRTNGDLQPQRFLHIAVTPELRAKLRAGELHIQPANTLDNGKKIKVPGGLVHHWMGAMFIPNATIADVKAAVRDYDNFKVWYKPEVIESRQVAHSGDEDDVFLRLNEKLLRVVVLNTNYHVRYSMLDPQHTHVTSHSTRIAELKDSKNPESDEEPIGNDSGIIWRFNWYWRVEQADGGVYAEWEMISLSRASIRTALDLQRLRGETAERVRDEHAPGYEGGGGAAHGHEESALSWRFRRHPNNRFLRSRLGKLLS
jgi:hypothetical protein